jgi:hypothetical protein
MELGDMPLGMEDVKADPFQPGQRAGAGKFKVQTNHAQIQQPRRFSQFCRKIKKNAGYTSHLFIGRPRRRDRSAADDLDHTGRPPPDRWRRSDFGACPAAATCPGVHPPQGGTVLNSTSLKASSICSRAEQVSLIFMVSFFQS